MVHAHVSENNAEVEYILQIRRFRIPFFSVYHILMHVPPTSNLYLLFSYAEMRIHPSIVNLTL
jgi:hypothetical protein